MCIGVVKGILNKTVIGAKWRDSSQQRATASKGFHDASMLDQVN